MVSGRPEKLEQFPKIIFNRKIWEVICNYLKINKSDLYFKLNIFNTVLISRPNEQLVLLLDSLLLEKCGKGLEKIIILSENLLAGWELARVLGVREGDAKRMIREARLFPDAVLRGPYPMIWRINLPMLVIGKAAWILAYNPIFLWRRSNFISIKMAVRLLRVSKEDLLKLECGRMLLEESDSLKARVKRLRIEEDYGLLRKWWTKARREGVI